MCVVSVLLVIALAATALIALAGAARVALRRVRRRRMADAIGEDWWPQFEEAFRDYAVGASRRQRETEQ